MVELGVAGIIFAWLLLWGGVGWWVSREQERRLREEERR